MSDEAFALTIIVSGLTAMTLVVTVIIWQIFATAKAKISVQREEAYKKLATDSAEALQQTASTLDRAVRELIELRSRATEVERLLKEVG